jgi:ABC-type transporter Mla MlaB component
MITLLLPASVQHANALACLDMLRSGLRVQGRGAPGSDVVVDGSGLKAFDSSVVSVLLEFAREAQAAGHRVRCLALPPHLRTLTGLYGVAELLPEVAA